MEAELRTPLLQEWKAHNEGQPPKTRPRGRVGDHAKGKTRPAGGAAGAREPRLTAPPAGRENPVEKVPAATVAGQAGGKTQPVRAPDRARGPGRKFTTDLDLSSEQKQLLNDKFGYRGYIFVAPKVPRPHTHPVANLARRMAISIVGRECAAGGFRRVEVDPAVRRAVNIDQQFNIRADHAAFVLHSRTRCAGDVWRDLELGASPWPKGYDACRCVPKTAFSTTLLVALQRQNLNVAERMGLRCAHTVDSADAECNKMYLATLCAPLPDRYVTPACPLASMAANERRALILVHNLYYYDPEDLSAMMDDHGCVVAYAVHHVFPKWSGSFYGGELCYSRRVDTGRVRCWLPGSITDTTYEHGALEWLDRQSFPVSAGRTLVWQNVVSFADELVITRFTHAQGDVMRAPGPERDASYSVANYRVPLAPSLGFTEFKFADRIDYLLGEKDERVYWTPPGIVDRTVLAIVGLNPSSGTVYTSAVIQARAVLCAAEVPVDQAAAVVHFVALAALARSARQAARLVDYAQSHRTEVVLADQVYGNALRSSVSRPFDWVTATALFLVCVVLAASYVHTANALPIGGGEEYGELLPFWITVLFTLPFLVWAVRTRSGDERLRRPGKLRGYTRCPGLEFSELPVLQVGAVVRLNGKRLLSLSADHRCVAPKVAWTLLGPVALGTGSAGLTMPVRHPCQLSVVVGLVTRQLKLQPVSTDPNRRMHCCGQMGLMLSVAAVRFSTHGAVTQIDYEEWLAQLEPGPRKRILRDYSPRQLEQLDRWRAPSPSVDVTWHDVHVKHERVPKSCAQTTFLDGTAYMELPGPAFKPRIICGQRSPEVGRVLGPVFWAATRLLKNSAFAKPNAGPGATPILFAPGMGADEVADYFMDGAGDCWIESDFSKMDSCSNPELRWVERVFLNNLYHATGDILFKRARDLIKAREKGPMRFAAPGVRAESPVVTQASGDFDTTLSNTLISMACVYCALVQYVGQSDADLFSIQSMFNWLQKSQPVRVAVAGDNVLIRCFAGSKFETCWKEACAVFGLEPTVQRSTSIASASFCSKVFLPTMDGKWTLRPPPGRVLRKHFIGLGDFSRIVDGKAKLAELRAALWVEARDVPVLGALGDQSDRYVPGVQMFGPSHRCVSDTGAVLWLSERYGVAEDEIRALDHELACWSASVDADGAAAQLWHQDGRALVLRSYAADRMVDVDVPS